jgi:hypothetical protein
MTTPAEPVTAEGRALLAMEDYNERSFPLITSAAIIAIEQAAARRERERIANEVEFLAVRSPSDGDKPGWYWDGWHAAIAAIAAELADPTPGEGRK